MKPDAEKRKKYNAYGDQWQYADQFAEAQQRSGWNPGRGSSGGTTYRTYSMDDLGNLGDFFQNMSGFDTGGGFRGTTSQPRARDTEYAIEVTLDESYHGSKRILNLQLDEPCNSCGGSGTIGRGRNRTVCSTCQGAGRIPRAKRLEVKVPAGVKDGSRIRIAGEGGTGSGGTRGDLYLVVKMVQDTKYERKGDDLYMNVPVPLLKAVLGGEVPIVTLKGRIALKIPPETQNSSVIRLSGQGMPRLGTSIHGDLYAKVNVMLPTKLTEKEKHLFEQLNSLHETR